MFKKENFMKKILALAVVLMFCSQVFAGELIIEKAKPKKKNIKKGEIQVSQDYSKTTDVVAAGESQDSVLQKMGKPNAVTKNALGEETWIYSQVQKTMPNVGYVNPASVMGTGAAAFNSRIATNGFGQNMYSGEVESTMPAVEIQDDYEVKNIIIKFNSRGIVENVITNNKEVK